MFSVLFCKYEVVIRLENFNFWYFMLYLIPESVVLYIVLLKRLSLNFTIKKLILASIITATGISIFRYYFLGYHFIVAILLYFIFINYYFKMNNYIKTLTSILLSLIIIVSIGEVFMMIYGIIFPTFSMNYMINAPVLVKLLIAYPILITFYIAYKFMPILFAK